MSSLQRVCARRRRPDRREPVIPHPSPSPGVAISLDPATGTWRVVSDTVRTLRAWRWGERRHLVSACSRGGRFDGGAFAAAVTATLFDPPPPPALVPLHAVVALDLLGVGHGAPPEPLGAAEARLASRFGWLPSAIAEVSALGLDSLLASLEPAPASGGSGGWNSIRVVDGPDG